MKDKSNKGIEGKVRKWNSPPMKAPKLEVIDYSEEALKIWKNGIYSERTVRKNNYNLGILAEMGYD